MYATYFGLSETPFNVTPDPRFLYVNECYQEAIAALRYGIEARKGFIALIGEAGTGKTTMLRRLMDALDPSCRTVLLLHPTVSFDEILEHILQELGIPIDGAGKLTMLQRLHEFLLEHTAAGGNVALLIDESQDLQTAVLEELRLLSNLETGKEKILQIVLAGQTELDQRFADRALRQLRQRITLQIRLRQLRADETAGYIDARLARVGGQIDRVFEPAAVARIGAVSGGIPRVVNVICDAAMLHAFATESPRVTAAIVDEAWSDYARGYQVMEGTPLLPAQVTRMADDTVVAELPVVPRAPAAVPDEPAPPPSPARAPMMPAAVAPSLPPPSRVEADPEAFSEAPPPIESPVYKPAAVLLPATEELTPAWLEPAIAPVGPSTMVAPLPEAGDGTPWRFVLSAAIIAAVGFGMYGLLRPRPPVVVSVSVQPPVTAVATLPSPPITAPLAPPPPTVPPAPPATTAAVPPPAAPAAEPLTPAEARALVESFRTAYEARDVQALGALLAPDIMHNESQGRSKVLGDYETAFAAIDHIAYRLANVQVALREQSTIVTSPFQITYQQGDGRRQLLRGSAEWRVERRAGQPLITALMYHFDS